MKRYIFESFAELQEHTEIITDTPVEEFIPATTPTAILAEKIEEPEEIPEEPVINHHQVEIEDLKKHYEDKLKIAEDNKDLLERIAVNIGLIFEEEQRRKITYPPFIKDIIVSIAKKIIGKSFDENSCAVIEDFLLEANKVIANENILSITIPPNLSDYFMLPKLIQESCEECERSSSGTCPLHVSNSRSDAGRSRNLKQAGYNKFPAAQIIIDENLSKTDCLIKWQKGHIVRSENEIWSEIIVKIDEYFRE